MYVHVCTLPSFLFLQVTWCGQVFTDPGTVLCTLITQTLTHLDPSLSSCITEFIKNESNIIEKLIELRQVRVHHPISVLLGPFKPGKPLPTPPHPALPPPPGLILEKLNATWLEKDAATSEDSLDFFPLSMHT